MKKSTIFILAAFLCCVQIKAQFNLAWANSVQGVWNQIGTGVATDASGNVYTVGTFSDVTDIDPTAGTQTILPNGTYGLDAYVIKQSSNGSLIWAKSFGGTGVDYPVGVAVDNSGNIYISGWFYGDCDLDPSASTYSVSGSGGTDIFMLKLNASGNFVWGKSMGTSSDDYATSMCIDGTGNIYTIGTFNGTMDFDPGAAMYPITSYSTGAMFVSKLDANGNFVFGVNFGSGSTYDEPNSICVDALNNVYLTGGFFGVAEFDPGASSYTLSSIDQMDAFACKLSNTGSFVWAAKFGGTQYQRGYSIATDGNNVYISGEFANTVDFDPGNGTFNISNPPNAGSNFALKLSNAGNFAWAKAIIAVPGNPTAAKNISVGSDGNVYWTGMYYNTLDFDPGSGTYNMTATGNDTYLDVLDPSGNFVKAATFPYPWNSFVVNSSTEIVVTGSFYNADFDPGPGVFNMNAGGAVDACIVKLGQGPNGVYESAGANSESNIYPNPNAGNFDINVPAGSQVKIVNSVGQTVSEFSVVSETQSVNLSNCKAGMYVLMINTNGKQVAKKFVIEN